MVIDLAQVGERFRVTLQLVHAEQLRTQRPIVTKLSEQTVNTNPGRKTFPSVANGHVQQLQSRILLLQKELFTEHRPSAQ